MNRYRCYRDSGVEWIGEIPEHWDKRDLQFVASKEKYSFTGGPFGSDLKSEEYTEHGIRIIQLQNIGVGEFLDDYKIYTSIEKADQLLSCNIYPGDIIIAKMADPVARACLMSLNHDRYLMASDGIRLNVNGELFDSNFVVYAINDQSFNIQAKINSRGTTRLRIGLTTLKKLKIIIPPLPEQKAIAQYLDQKTTIIDDLIEKTTKKIALLKEQRTAIINQAVTCGLDESGQLRQKPEYSPADGIPQGWKDSDVEWIGVIPEHWDSVKFKYLASIANGQVDPKLEPFSTMILVGPIHIKSGSGKIINRETAVDQGAESGKYMVQSGQIIYSKIRPELRKACIAVEDCLCSADMYPIQTNLNVNPKFLLYEILDEPFSQFMIEKSMRVAMPKVNRNDLQEYVFVIPTIGEQKKIAQYLEKITTETDELIVKEEKRIDLLKEYRKALISEVVTGKICVLDKVANNKESLQ